MTRCNWSHPTLSLVLSLVQALEGPGNGRVLVVDGGGSTRCALVGDQLAVLAVKNGWKVRSEDCSQPMAAPDMCLGGAKEGPVTDTAAAHLRDISSEAFTG